MFIFRDISPPRGIVQAMELQAEAERRKRASILESEGLRQSKINVAEAGKQEVSSKGHDRALSLRRLFNFLLLIHSSILAMGDLWGLGVQRP